MHPFFAKLPLCATASEAKLDASASDTGKFGLRFLDRSKVRKCHSLHGNATFVGSPSRCFVDASHRFKAAAAAAAKKAIHSNASLFTKRGLKSNQKRGKRTVFGETPTFSSGKPTCVSQTWAHTFCMRYILDCVFGRSILCDAFRLRVPGKAIQKWTDQNKNRFAKTT